MNENDRIYLAGLFDGRGIVSIYNNKSSPSIRIHLASSNRLLLQMLKSEFGGTINNRTSRTGLFWCLYDKKVYQFLKIIEPYVRFKKREVSIGLKFSKLYSRNGHVLPVSIRRERFSLFEELNEIKY